MVEAVCACGQKQSVTEDRLGDVAPCPCGRGIACVSAEQLPSGAGNGDFDARLIVTAGPAEVGKQILLGGCLEIELGKLPERHVALAGPKVSRLHAKLERVDFGPSRWKLVDNNSTNGVFVNGEKISEKDLENGDVIQMGDYELRFENEAVAELVEEEPPMAQLAHPAQPAQARRQGRVRASTDDAEILAIMRQLQNKQSSWLMAILLLVVSFLAFVGSSFAESGHYIAMRLFNYRNVRMFFIPFFGAAVSGRHYSAPAWKKVIVSLMGPMPGIILGGIVGMMGVELHSRTTLVVGLLAIIVNGFNLLPVLPLDGGRIMQTLVFSRHYLLDAGFRLVAAGAMIVLGIFLERILLYVGIGLLVSLPVSMFQGKIALQMRKEGWGDECGDDIADEVALAIIQRVRADLFGQKMKKQKNVANCALSVYELLASQPPKLLPACGFLGVYGLGIVVACAVPVLMVLEIRSHVRHEIEDADQQAGYAMMQATPPPLAAPAQNNSVSVGQASALPNTQAPVAAPPAGAVPQGMIVRVGAGGAAMKLTDAIVWPHDLVLANFDTQAAADNEFSSAAGTTARGEVLEKFGQTIFACVPKGNDAAKGRWTSELSAHGKDTRADTDQGVSFVTIICTAPSDKDADDLQKDWQTYFLVPGGLHLIPPWMPNDSRSAAELAKNELARQTYWKILNVNTGRDAQIEQMSRQMFSAAARRDRARAQTIAQQIADRRTQLRQQSLNDMANTKDGSVDTELVKEYQALPAPKITEDETGDVDSPQWLAMGQRMGQLPLVGGKPAAGSEQYSTRMGFLGRRGSTVRVELARFADPPSGAPAMVDWLTQHHFTNIQYHVDIMPDAGTMRVRRNPVFFP